MSSSCRPLLLLPFIFPIIRAFSNESVLRIRLKYWSFSISLSYDYSGLIYFRIDCFELLAVQGTLKSLLDHRSSKALLHCSVCFMVRLTSIIAPGKTVALTIGTFEAVAEQVAASSSCARPLVTVGTRRMRVLAPFPSGAGFLGDFAGQAWWPPP